MDPDAVALHLAEFHDRLAAADGQVLIHGQVGGLRYQIVGADEASPFPSGNPNKARWYVGEMDEVCIDEAISRFDAHDVPLWFLHVYGEGDRSQVQDCAERYGLEPFEGTSYPILIHPLRVIDDHPTELTIRELGPVPPDQAHMLGGPLHGAPARALATRGQATFFGAFANNGEGSDDDLVALAGVMQIRDAAYLGWAITREDQRGRGAQSALIRARLRWASDRGCLVAISETLAMLKTSLANLERAGFRQISERLVMRCGEG